MVGRNLLNDSKTMKSMNSLFYSDYNTKKCLFPHEILILQPFYMYGLRQIQEKLRPFAQFHNSREFDHLIRNMVKEKELKLRLQELYKYRSNGITRPDECVEFERTKLGPGLRGKRSAGQMLETLDEDDDNDNEV